MMDKTSSGQEKSAQPGRLKGLGGLIALALLYILSPIDLLPEGLLGPLGLIDDAALLAYVAKRIFFK